MVLMYHRIGPSTRRGALELSDFERQILHLRERHQLYTCSGLVRRLEERRASADSVAVTIDDGYAEVYEDVFPFLRRLAVPATVYVVTDFVDGETWLWPDRLAHVMLSTRRAHWVFESCGQRRSYALQSVSERLAAWSDCADWLLTLPPGSRDQYIQDVARDLRVDMPLNAPPGYGSLSWAQLREMAAAGIEIGSHSCTHPRLTLLGADQLHDEVLRSKRRLEQMLERPVRSFCYPHGTLADVDDVVVAAVRSAGYENAVTSVPSPSRSFDPFLVPRYGVTSRFESFLATLARVGPLR